MSNYYFLIASLPPLVLGEKPQLSFGELKERLAINLSKKDLEKVVVFRRYVDLQNLLSFFLEEPLDPRGNLDEKELDEALVLEELPAYVFVFLQKYPLLADRIKYFSELLIRFFLEETPKQEGFLQRYLRFEREWRLVLTGLRAKALQRDLLKELQFEEGDDPFVRDLLRQKDGESYNPPEEYAALKTILQGGLNPREIHRAFAEFRLGRIEELKSKEPFSLDALLAYMAELMIVEYAHELDENKGRVIFDALQSG